MEDLGKIFTATGTLFILLTILMNLEPRFPKVPGDITISLLERKASWGYNPHAKLKLYIPLASFMVMVSLLLLIFLWFIK